MLGALHQILLATKCRSGDVDLCAAAVTTFASVAPVALAAANDVHQSSPDTVAPIWMQFFDTFKGFLSPQAPSSSDLDTSAQFESLQIQMVQVLCTQLLPKSPLAPSSVLEDLIRLLVETHEPRTVLGLKPAPSMQEPAGKVRLMQSMLQGVFALCHVPNHMPQLAAIAQPILLEHCKRRLHAFVNDDCRTG